MFPTTEPLSLVALGLLVSLSKYNSAHENILVVTDRCTKLTRAILLRSTTSQVDTNALLAYWAEYIWTSGSHAAGERSTDHGATSSI